MEDLVYKLEKKALNIKLNLLKLCSMQTIHIGGDLSIADVMTVLWQYQMHYDPHDIYNENRDRFILSKGHASAVTSFNQAAIGCFSTDDIFQEYATDFGRFSMHSCNLVNQFVEVSTGSLGHGMPVACGIAAALRLKNNRCSRVYTVMGDGEQSEGSIWEAVNNATHYKLGNLVAILDFNKLEADGRITDLTSLGNIVERYIACGWRVREINGHDISAIVNEFNMLPDPNSSVPTIIVCHTIKGNGIPFMANEARWHAGKISEEEFIKSRNILIAEFEKRWNVVYEE